MEMTDYAGYLTVARWTVWCAWCGALALFGLKVAWPWLDKLTAFGKANPEGVPPARYSRWLGLSSRAVFTLAYAGGFLLNLVLLSATFFLLKQHELYPRPPQPAHLTSSSLPEPSPTSDLWMNHPYVLYAVLLQVHLGRRLLECLFVHRFSPRAVSDAGALLACAYYFFVCVGPWIEFTTDALASPSRMTTTTITAWPWIRTAVVVSGCLLFVYASWHQHVAHRILADLRKSPEPRAERASNKAADDADRTASDADLRHRRVPSSSNEREEEEKLVKAPTGRYGLPSGDWFEHVSSPHYLAEILIYVGFVLIAGSHSLCLWFILAFVVANLVRSALQTHQWYQTLFPKGSFPKHRRAIVPYLL